VNFLGHLSLAWPHPALMVGGFLGDFVKGPLKSEFPVEIESGIRLHRRIDARSDCNESVTELKSELPKEWARYAGILADLYCDHLVSNPANRMLGQPTDLFADECHSLLLGPRHIFGGRAKYVFDNMSEGRWLEQYANLNFTAKSLERIGMRLRFDNPLAHSAEILERHATSLDRCCRSLYSDMQRVVAEWQLEESSLSIE